MSAVRTGNVVVSTDVATVSGGADGVVVVSVVLVVTIDVVTDPVVDGDTVRFRGIETGQIETILIRASVSPRKIETLLLGPWWP